MVAQAIVALTVQLMRTIPFSCHTEALPCGEQTVLSRTALRLVLVLPHRGLPMLSAGTGRCYRPESPSCGSNVDTASPCARFARISGSLRASHSRALARPSSNSSSMNQGVALNLLDAS
jgi:hypothetical protein